MQITARSIAIAGMLALLPAIAIGGGLALPVLACVTGVLCIRPLMFSQLTEKLSVFLLALAAFWLWVMVTVLWSPNPATTQTAKLAILAPLALAVVWGAGDPRGRGLVAAAIVVACTVLAALLTVEALWDLPLNQAAAPATPLGELGRKVSRASTILLALTWGAAAALLKEGRDGLARATLLLGGLLMLPFGQFATAIAYGTGLLAFALAFAAPRATIFAATGGLAAWVVGAPFLTPWISAQVRDLAALPQSWSIRIEIWDYVCAQIVEKPWFGHGLDASRAVASHVQVGDERVRGILLHPHSASLQIWYETGLVGAALAAITLVLGGWRLARVAQQNRHAAAAAAGALVSLGLVANVSYGVWQEWWIATLFLAAASVAAVRAGPSGQS